MSILRIYSASGSVETTLDLNVPPGNAAILGEPRPGTLLVALGEKLNEDHRLDGWHLFLVDLEAGKLLSRTEGLVPLHPRAFWSEPTLQPPDNNSWRFFLDPKGSLIRFEPLSGERRTILGGL